MKETKFKFIEGKANKCKCIMDWEHQQSKAIFEIAYQLKRIADNQELTKDES